MTLNTDGMAGSAQSPHGPTLARVRAFRIDQAVIDFTVRFLVKVGRRGFEGLVLWGGRLTPDGEYVEVVLAVAPRQKATRGEEGVLVAVDGDELFRVNADFYGRGLLLCAQVHSHPGQAYHSDTDDAFAIYSRIVKESSRADSRYRRDNREWIQIAKTKLDTSARKPS